jgi:uncharacterized protein
MRLVGRALRLSFFVGEGETWRDKSLFSVVVHRAHKAVLAGATVIS